MWDIYLGRMLLAAQTEPEFTHLLRLFGTWHPVQSKPENNSLNWNNWNNWIETGHSIDIIKKLDYGTLETIHSIEIIINWNNKKWNFHWKLQSIAKSQKIKWNQWQPLKIRVLSRERERENPNEFHVKNPNSVAADWQMPHGDIDGR